MLRSVIFALALAFSSPAVPQAPQTPPIDIAARAKFSHDDGAAIDALSYINRVVNDSIQYESDQEHYGTLELWVMFPQDGKGDCEDYALTKMGILSQAGFPIVTNAKMVGVIVHRRAKDGTDDGGGHAILAVLLPSGAVAYLDSMNEELMTREELVREGYEFFDWRA